MFDNYIHLYTHKHILKLYKMKIVHKLLFKSLHFNSSFLRDSSHLTMQEATPVVTLVSTPASIATHTFIVTPIKPFLPSLVLLSLVVTHSI
jgi:hypothetical protein